MQRPLPVETLSNIVALIYDSAVIPARWPDALALINSELDFGNSGLTLLDVRSGEVPLSIMVGSAPEWIARNSHFAVDAVELWGGPEKILTYPMNEPFVLSRTRDRSLWSDNRYFVEWGRPQGLHDIMTIPLSRDHRTVGSLGLGRHDSAGEIGDIEVDAARLLLPHLQRAVAVGRLLDIKSVVSSTFDATLDTLAVAVVLTDADLHIIHANAAARELFSANGPVREQHGVLRVRPPAVETALGVAVRQATDDETGIGRRGFGLPAARAGDAPYVLHLLPLRHGKLRPGLSANAAVAVFIAPMDLPLSAPADALTALYDFTPAEARVFAHIAAGRSRTETAAELGSGATTVKTHLSRIFAKTGTRRQAELVALNASIALPLRGGR